MANIAEGFGRSGSAEFFSAVSRYRKRFDLRGDFSHVCGAGSRVLEQAGF
jgi:hypothetical protein